MLRYVHAWPKTDWGSVEGRIGVRNLFDKTYLLRDGSGVGVGAPQFGERRTWFTALDVYLLMERRPDTRISTNYFGPWRVLLQLRDAPSARLGRHDCHAVGCA